MAYCNKMESLNYELFLQNGAQRTQRQDKQKPFDARYQYKKRAGVAGIGGQLYEIYLSMLFLLQGVTHKSIRQFHLATNMKEAGLFDDVVFGCNYKNLQNEDKSKVVFLQAKHRETASKEITLETLFAEKEKGDFLLNKYFYCFREIKQVFLEHKYLPHALFQSGFNNSEFVIYTNALLKYGESEAGNFEKVDIEKDSVFNLIGTNIYYYRLTLSGNKREKIIRNLKRCSNCKRLAVALAQCIACENGVDLSKAIIAKYNVTLAESVIEAIEGTKEGKFKKSFLENEGCAFRNAFFKEIRKLKGFTENTEELKLKLSKLILKLPNKFGNVDKDGTVLPLPEDIIREEDIADFLSKLRIFVAQPNESELRNILMKKIKVIYNVGETDVDTVFSHMEWKVRNWWKDGNDYLTKKNTFFEDSARVSIKFNVKDPVPIFTGRSKMIEELHETLQRTSFAIITGMGGLGKTELVKKYITEHSKDYDGNILWIQADGTLHKSLRRLAKDKLGININRPNNNEKDIGTLIAEVYQFFAEKGRKSLFIYDNAQNEENESISMLLPSGQNKPYIIITSREKNWNGLISLQLELFSEEEALDFIKNSLNFPRFNKKEAKQLASKFQYLPLALRQAVAYITMENYRLIRWENKNFTIGNYLDRFEKSGSELLGKPANEIHDTYTKTALTTWQLTIDKIMKIINGEQALEVLNIIAYLVPDNNVVKHIFPNIESDAERRSSIELLDEYFIAKLEAATLSVHKLVQQATRIKLQQENKEEAVLDKILLLFDGDINSNNLENALSAWNYAKKYSELVKKFNLFPSYIINTLRDTVRYKEAYSFAASSTELLQTILGDEHIATLNVMHCTATILYEQGKYNEAILLYQDIFNKGKEHPDIFIIMNNIALIFYNQQKYTQALKFFKEAEEKSKQVFGPTHHSTLIIMNNIGLILNDQGKHGEAIELYEEILNKMNVSHPSRLGVMNNMALSYRSQGKYRRALTIYQEVLEKAKQTLCANHPNILNIMNNIAIVYYKQGEYKLAETMFQEVLEKRKRILGFDHPGTLAVIDNIALLFETQGKHGEYLTLYEEQLNEMKSILGPDHPATLGMMNNVGLAFYKQGKYRRALSIYEQVLEKNKQSLGPHHLHTLITMESIAAVYCKQNRNEEAITLYQEVLMQRIQILGPDDPLVLSTNQKLDAIQHTI